MFLEDEEKRKGYPKIYQVAVFMFASINPVISCLIRKIWRDKVSNEYVYFRRALTLGTIDGFIVKPILYIMLLAHPELWIH